MRRIVSPGIGTTAIVLFFVLTAPVHAALINQVNQAYRQIHGRNPTFSQWSYWAGRVQRKEKTTYDALVGAIAYQKTHGGASTATVISSSVQAASTFKTNKSAYPSPYNPNFLPDGTLVKSPTKPQVFYIRNGKKSWVLPSILNRWLGENHYFKSDIIITISDADLARYPQTSSVNTLYIGKVLLHPNGTKYFIDDKLRKRPISDSVRRALKFPSGNLYPTSAAHLREFRTGSAITRADIYPGGMVVYSGPFRGGKIWRIEEVAGGKIVKRLYLSDYIYEADGYPDESQRAPIDAAALARHARGSNIQRYKDGWVVGIGNDIYVVQKGKLRRIASPQIFAAMGYKHKYVLKRHPDFLKRYPHGTTISAFKNIVAGEASIKPAPAPPPSTSSNLMRVRPHVRTLISQINDLFLTSFDKQITPSENKFWVDYVYQGEVNNKADLIEAMKTAKQIGRNPARTPRTTPISLDKLKSHWFPYLFYFTHQKEPTEDDKVYWYSRIRSGDKDTINGLGGTIQWLKDVTGATRR